MQAVHPCRHSALRNEGCCGEHDLGQLAAELRRAPAFYKYERFILPAVGRKGAGLYFAGLRLLLLVQASPLHFLAMHYLFSAHMVGHIILLLLCAPLLVLGLPKQVGPNTERILTAISRVLSRRPWLGWLSGIVVMWFWHIPAVFDGVFPATQANGLSLLPLLLTFSLLLAGVLFTWPILGPVPKYRINPLVGVV